MHRVLPCRVCADGIGDPLFYPSAKPSTERHESGNEQKWSNETSRGYYVPSVLLVWKHEQCWTMSTASSFTSIFDRLRDQWEELDSSGLHDVKASYCQRKATGLATEVVELAGETY